MQQPLPSEYNISTMELPTYVLFLLSLLRLVLLFGPPEEVVFDEEELVRLRDVVLRGLFTTIMGGSFVIGSIQLH